MRKVKVRRSYSSKVILFILCIITLSFIGVSYAYWNNKLDMITRVSTGFLGVNFDDSISGSDIYQITYNDDRSEMLVEGVVEENITEVVTETQEAIIITAQYSDYDGYLGYNIVENGTVDAKLSRQDILKDDALILEETPGYAEGRWLHIKAGQGVYDFEIQLHYTN